MDHSRSEPTVLQAIRERRSVRHFLDAPVDRNLIREVLEAACWAPSGLNNQPWRFAVVRDPELKEKILDRETSYDYVKDCQAVGAAIQNMLLAIHARGLGAVWIGEILKNKDKVREALELPERLELMAVVAVGHPAHRKQSSHRRPLEEVVVLER
jgi:nitroreductase